MDSRAKIILENIISHYVRFAEPVGSRALSKNVKLDVSPATVRNVMADLTEIGLISQPHRSAGRIPTDKGYRYYINNLLSLNKRRSSKYAIIKKKYIDYQPSKLEDILIEATEELSKATNCAGVTICPGLEFSILRKVEFIRLNDNQILVILVTKIGVVRNKILNFADCPKQSALDKASYILSGLFEGEAISSIIDSLEESFPQEGEDDALSALLLRLGREAFDIDLDNKLYVRGPSKMCLFPEFSDQGNLMALYKMFEEKTKLVNIMLNFIKGDGIQIKVGNENTHNALSKCSVIVGTYGSKGYLSGTIGVIGPTRMNYQKVITAIDYSAQKVSYVLDRFLDNN